MTARVLAILVLAGLAVSCDKVKTLAGKASTAAQKALDARGKSGAAPQVDPALQKLVDQTAEGALFRKDLPFPTQLEVLTTTRHEKSTRVFESSAIEKRSQIVKGVQLTITKLERTGQEVRYKVEKSSMTLPAPLAAPGEKGKTSEPIEQVAPPVPPITFRKRGQTWEAADSADFRAAMVTKQLAPKFEQLLVNHALAPRPMWLGARRFKPGDELVVTGEELRMLLEGDAKGTFKLKLESFEAVEGHPCGVFAVTADYRSKQVPDFEGNLIDEEITITGGKLWLSLLYPIVLREELETIQSYKSGGQGGLVTRAQGAVNVALRRAWKTVGP